MYTEVTDSSVQWRIFVKRHLAVFLFVLSVCCPSLARGQSTSVATFNPSESESLRPYHLIKTIPLSFLKKMSGQLGFDHETGRLFFSDGKDLVVLNSSTGERVGIIPRIANVSDIAFASDIHRVFLVDSFGRDLFDLDLPTLTLIQKTNVGAESSFVLYDSETREVFTAGTGSSTCKVFDAVTNKKVAAAKLRGYPVRAANDMHGHIYFEVTPNDPRLPPLSVPGTYITPLKTDLAELDTRSLAVGDRWDEASCPHMVLMGVDRFHQELVIGCQSSVTLVDPQTRKITAFSAIVGVKPIAPITVNAALGDAFFLGLDERADSHRVYLEFVHEDSTGHLGPAVLAPQLPGRPAAFDDTTQHMFIVQSDTKIVDSGLFLAPAGRDMTPLRVPQPIPGTFRILVYSRN